MLISLTVKNYILIDTLVFEPSNAFTTITGETGAGKSILLGAIGLLMGERAEAGVLLDTSQKCIVEGVFSIERYDLQEFFELYDLDYTPECTIRREIASQGKSRAFINDTPVTLEPLKLLVSKLLDVHSQQDQSLLSESGFQLKTLDALAQQTTLFESYKVEFKQLQTLEKSIAQLRTQQQQQTQELSFWMFQLEELQAAKLEVQELEQLESELEILEHAEEIKTLLAEADGLLHGQELGGMLSMGNRLVQISDKLQQISTEKYKHWHDRLKSLVYELKDISSEFQKETEKVEHDPIRIEALRQRLDILYTLQKKHQVGTIAELIEIQNALEVKTNSVLGLDDQLDALLAKQKILKPQVELLAEQLHTGRLFAAQKLSDGMGALLADLGMPSAQIRIDLQTIDLHAMGFDKPIFLFSANKGSALQELHKVASGGEFSRFMFALKYVIAQSAALPTLVFDEIDTGISGEVTQKMASMMQKLGDQHQVISISHQALLAAKADTHYFVYKSESTDRTYSHLKKLELNDRILAIAQMIGGASPSALAVGSAKEMLGVQ